MLYGTQHKKININQSNSIKKFFVLFCNLCVCVCVFIEIIQPYYRNLGKYGKLFRIGIGKLQPVRQIQSADFL